TARTQQTGAKQHGTAETSGEDFCLAVHLHFYAIHPQEILRVVFWIWVFGRLEFLFWV
ncbi:hypothetical protein NL676_021410, partial [Syzygium grande]